MSTARTWQIESTSLDDTLKLAGRVGRNMRGGEAIELVSDLGGGKTAFMRGLARGMGSKDSIHSPSFTLSNEYRAGGLTIHHFDFYRLGEPGIMRDELAELIGDPQTVVAVEWADIVEDVLPDERLTILIKTTGETNRHFTLNYPPELSYLVPLPRNT